MHNLFSMTCADLENWLRLSHGKGAFHAKALYHEVMGRGNRDFALHPAFEKSQKLALAVEGSLDVPEARIVETAGTDDSFKFVTALDDGLRIESVILTMESHETLCLSTQVGCRMGCAFCETGTMGLIRNLQPEEMVLQVMAARYQLQRPVRNVVYMGMGEPMDNLDAVLKAVEILSDQRGLNIPLRRQTLSTVGLVPGFKRLASMESMRPLHLSLSLNAASDDLRSELMPVNRAFPLALLKKTLAEYPLPSGGAILLAYVLIPGVNDSREDAMALADFAEGLPVRINLIPYNPGTCGRWPATEDKDIHRFGALLYEKGLFVRKRWSRGREVMAGCGQLGGRPEKDSKEKQEAT
ncbi:23S rRNA (adenine(2503)-C(2))-methyltransferase RlmN [Desulfobotulus mexicanus]|uniref:23S rRNA (Adenine(2503)-C(2))-methyltransferase RlmN n=1 Tax=Desulfobotulus mexicanus TaxID=2586642 RepID=A0A5Q4VB02_9BACT|nr:23S rRNA (adenine(2503)-C(2))-methyltransferase RlmN [Desulfobotulus mexicanus]TYT74934.1 23S rRNA (adenine(2503)-C(2))-methyltransferase RlmN [Desulfobotulus mexicanus]